MSNVISLDNGDCLYNDHGKYRSGLTWLWSPGDKEVVYEGENKPRFFTCDWSDFNLESDGWIEKAPGDYFVSKKGTKCFRFKKDGKHLLLKIHWGGCFNTTRGRFDAPADQVLYSNRASSNGGGTGYNYVIVPVDFKRVYNEDDI